MSNPGRPTSNKQSAVKPVTTDDRDLSETTDDAAVETALKTTDTRPPRWAKDTELAKYVGVTKMCIHRWRHDPRLKFPRSHKVNNRLRFTDLNDVDRWIKSRAAKRSKVAA
jgi:predicted DNA-binding transcriptional regulator AlpA